MHLHIDYLDDSGERLPNVFLIHHLSDKGLVSVNFEVEVIVFELGPDFNGFPRVGAVLETV